MTDNFIVKGNVPAVITPFNAKGQIDYDAYDTILDWHISRGVDGICVAGDNGESWALLPEDRSRLTSHAVKAAEGKFPVITGASATTARQSIGYAEALAETGVTALMIGPQPYVMKATVSELVARIESIHRAVPLPIVLYNSPRRTNIGLTVETMRALTDAVPIVALKEASRDFFYLTHIIHEFRDRLAVLVGPAPFIIPGMQLGAAGFISSGPEFLGDAATQAAAAGGMPMDDTLRDIHYRFTRIYETLMRLGTWPSSMKAAHNLLGLPGGSPHEPVCALEGHDLTELERVLKEIGATRD
jgi:4-hydroxy-tetrahydrodipicolinate synthase